ncbi:MAG: DUF3566 domain-containing protein [Chloroflexota bacterium]
MRYTIRRVSPYSALFYGLLIGLVAWLIPGILLGRLVAQVVTRLAAWAQSLQLEIPLPLGQSLSFDLINLLQLTESQARLAALAARDTSLIIAVALATAAAGMLLTGLITLLAALVYNLFAQLLGGIQVTLDPLDGSMSPVGTQGRPTATGQRATPIAEEKTVAVGMVAKSTPDHSVAPSAQPAKDPALSSSAWLVSAADQTRRWRLANGVTRIGSEPSNDIVVSGLAPHHAEIRREDGRYIIYDLGSRQTWVNTSQVATTHLLKNGFSLQLGTADFVVQILTTAS